MSNSQIFNHKLAHHTLHSQQYPTNFITSTNGRYVLHISRRVSSFVTAAGASLPSDTDTDNDKKNTTPRKPSSPLGQRLRNVFKFNQIVKDPQTLAKKSSLNSKVDEKYRVFLDEWDKGFMDAVEQNDGYYAKVVYGEIPCDLEGTFFRNGPGKFTLGATRIPHPYDGDSLVASVAFKNGTAFFRSRFVSTREFEAEKSEDTVLFRGTFATQRAGGAAMNAFDLYVKNTSNTNVVCFGDRLWSLFEASQPYRLDPYTLKTVGLELLDGLFKPGLPFDLGSSANNAFIASLTKLAQRRFPPLLPESSMAAGGDAVTAHPHICPRTGRLVTFSYKVRPVVPTRPDQAPFVTDFTFYELEETTLQPGVVEPVRYTLPGFAFLHDFALTENYYIIFQNPVTVDNVPYLLGQAPAASCVRWIRNTPTKIHFIPRTAPTTGKNNSNAMKPQNIHTTTASDAKNDNDKKNNNIPRVYTAPPLFVFHHANAFESVNSHGERCVTIDSIHYDSLPAVGREALAQQAVDPDAAFTSRLRRVEVNIDTNVLKVRRAFDGYLEMPAINPDYASKKHTYVYGYHSIFEDPQIGVAKIHVEGRTVELWKPGKNRFVLEPRFIPRKTKRDNNDIDREEDDGWLIAQLFDSDTRMSEIVLLDAQDLSQGPVAVIALNEPLPSALHGCWSDTYYYRGEP